MLPCPNECHSYRIQQRVPKMLAENGSKHDGDPLKQDMKAADKGIDPREGEQLLFFQLYRHHHFGRLATAVLFELRRIVSCVHLALECLRASVSVNSCCIKRLRGLCGCPRGWQELPR